VTSDSNLRDPQALSLAPAGPPHILFFDSLDSLKAAKVPFVLPPNLLHFWFSQPEVEKHGSTCMP